MDWRQRPFRTRKTAAPPAAPDPEAIRKEACKRLLSAVRSAAPHAHQSLIASVSAMDRVLASAVLDESNERWYRTIRSVLQWTVTAREFAAGRQTARDAVRSMGHVPGDGSRRSRPHPRHGFAVLLSSARAGRRDMQVTLEAEYGREVSTMDPAVLGEKRAVALVHDLIGASHSFDDLVARQRFAEGEQVEELAAALMFTTRDSHLDWERVRSSVIAAIDPAVGLALASRFAHYGPMPPETDGQTALGVFARTVERAMRRMLDPSVPDPYRRMLASIIYDVTAYLIDSRDNYEADGRPIVPCARLYWTDLHLASAHRADSVFFGQGPVGKPSEEASWRAGCYHARDKIDDAAWFEACITALEFGGFPYREEKELTRAIEVLAAFLPDADPVVEQPMYEELRGRLETGRSRGWIASPTGLESSADELERWLVSVPGVAVLSSTGMGLWYLTFAGEDGKLAEVLLADEREGRTVGGDDDDQGTDVDELSWLQDCLNQTIRGRTVEDEDGRILSVETTLKKILQNAATIAIGQRLASEIRRRRLSTILVLASGGERTWPWEGITVDEQGTTLAELASFVHVYSLLPIATRETDVRDGTLRLVSGDDPAVPLRDAWPSDIGESALPTVTASVDELQTCGILRLLTQGGVDPADGMFTRIRIGERRLSAREIRALDLTGCGRVELWGCPLHDMNDAFDVLMPYRGPTNIGACFHLAGAGVVLGCPWQVPLFAASLVAAGFSTEAPPLEGAEADARALARAIRRYRDAVKPDGVVERAIRSALAADRDPSETFSARSRSLGRAYSEGWTAAFHQLRSAVSVPSSPDVAVPDPSTYSPWFQRRVAGFLDSLRASYSWAGWRVVARDRRCIAVPHTAS
jgi:hypothetical protein